LYLCAKNQNILKKSLSKKPWQWLGWLCQIVALTGWLLTLGTATAIFVWLSFFMLLIGTLPFLPLYRLLKNNLAKENQTKDNLSKERLVRAK
jgi:hypothetical protein